MPQNREFSIKAVEETAERIATALDQTVIASLESAGFLSEGANEGSPTTIEDLKKAIAQLDAAMPKSDFVFAPVSAQDIERIESSPKPRRSMSHMLEHRKKRIRKKWRKRLPSRFQVEWDYTQRVLPPGYALIEGKFYALNMKEAPWDFSPRFRPNFFTRDFSPRAEWGKLLWTPSV